MPLQCSELIEREKLYAVSGGGGHHNPLKLATPILYCGGRALATKKKVVAHMTVKEASNLPLPSNQDEDFVLWRFASRAANPPYDFVSITSRNAQNEYTHQQGIPLFWEPENQKKDKIKKKKESKVQYAGHWRLKDSSVETKELFGQERCGSLTFSFDRFDENFAKVIAKATSMTVQEIAKYDFDTMLNTAAVNTRCADENTLVEVKAESATRAIKTEENIKVEAPSPRKRKVRAKAKVATSVPKGKKKKRRHASEEASDENAAADNDSKPAARASTRSLQSKALKDYTKDEVFDLVYEKGPKFHSFAKTLKDADIRGKLIAKQLAKGDDDAFLTFLEDVLGFEDKKVYRFSVMESFKEFL